MRITTLLTATSLLALASPALGQETAAPPPAGDASDSAARGPQAAVMEDIVVTGSRIQSGFDQPTPVATVGAAQLQQAQPASIAAGLNQLPQFAGSSSPTQTNVRTAQSFQGNVLNLRNVGGNRTLILLDGVRVPPTTAQGEVNVDILPELLISRVDVVTAGVSAVYGSDAVSGVVNYILDTRFKGVKGLAQRGISKYGDAGSYRIGVAIGQGFFDDRLHMLLSAERTKNDGIARNDRPLGDDLWQAVVLNPGLPGTAANPYVFRTNVLARNYSRGGKIIAGPASLLNQQFDDSGRVIPFDPGISGGALSQIGGSALAIPVNRTLFADIRTDRAFGRLSYDVTPGITAYAEVMGARAKARFQSGSHTLSFPIFSGNAFLRPEVQAAIDAAAGQPNPAAASCGNGAPAVFCLFTPAFDIPQPRQLQQVDSYSVKTGIGGDIGGGWRFDATFVHGWVRTRVDEYDSVINQRLFAAVDAVRDPATGATVCRVTLTNPGLYPGCQPLNPFGFGNKSATATAYIQGTSFAQVTNTTDDVVFNLAGEPFSTWAGPVGLAIGLEYREAGLTRTSNSDPALTIQTTGIRGISPRTTMFNTTNVGTAFGSNNVKEANIELLVPLADALPFAHSLAVSGAARYTDYSTSGTVWTWKIGGTYEPVRDVRFRATRSRDIRAPTLFDLFAGATFGLGTVNDPHCNCQRPGGFAVVGGGNPGLKPEIANTFSAGVVLQPAFIPGLRASVDYYDLKLRDVITTLTLQDILQDCENAGGAGPTCAFITRPLAFSDRTPANVVTQVFQGSINAASLRTTGVDVEISYDMPLDRLSAGMDGRLQFRLLANYVDRYDTQNSVAAPLRSTAGFTDSAIPKWRGTFNATYSQGPYSLFVQERMIGALKTGNQFVYEVKKLPVTWYTDMTATASIGDGNLDIFLSVNNLFDQKPRLFPSFAFPGVSYPTVQSVYDVMGRYFTAGAKFRF